ncbi:MAG: hypothetical protein COU46_03205 [Candidatus Niyogibacteria bacterium CG10_big_fil_rev_8_21_14_0_10_42_19]|uniref:Uncharacterized protein n=1 Tax=Candidatus Niyogibacteria bacterium CG10_big_fil_rev_8_21_14_0_10_42_19 TaxID=1974725 RepID=A0A2H0TF18_9BACT|nr:MAG: hypothetical protein COU46_03205 [Candidatus Niyogibacteria bacterium CG10_big_fil_rev_8_21_14_0_10_42_19]
MWQGWVNGFLGLWIVLLPFLGLPQNIDRPIIIAIGIIVAIAGFWCATFKGKRSSVSDTDISPPAERV